MIYYHESSERVLQQIGEIMANIEKAREDIAFEKSYGIQDNMKEAIMDHAFSIINESTDAKEFIIVNSEEELKGLSKKYETMQEKFDEFDVRGFYAFEDFVQEDAYDYQFECNHVKELDEIYVDVDIIPTVI